MNSLFKQLKNSIRNNWDLLVIAVMVTLTTLYVTRFGDHF